MRPGQCLDEALVGGGHGEPPAVPAGAPDPLALVLEGVAGGHDHGVAAAGQGQGPLRRAPIVVGDGHAMGGGHGAHPVEQVDHLGRVDLARPLVTGGLHRGQLPEDGHRPDGLEIEGQGVAVLE